MKKIRKKRENIVGRVYNRLTVIQQVENDKFGKKQWLCKCECGNTTVLATSLITCGKTKSCGCIRSEMMREKQTKHGQSNEKTPEYTAWRNMVNRCYNPKNHHYPRYGGRGIGVCERWRHSFENFFEDMGVKPYPKLTLDRVDNDLWYYKDNCRWVTNRVQSCNRGNNHWIEHDGRRMVFQDWANELQIRHTSLRSFLKKGRSFEQAYIFFSNKIEKYGKPGNKGRLTRASRISANEHIRQYKTSK